MYPEAELKLIIKLVSLLKLRKKECESIIKDDYPVTYGYIFQAKATDVMMDIVNLIDKNLSSDITTELSNIAKEVVLI